MPTVNSIAAVWQGDHRFETGREGAPKAIIDGDAVAGQSPMDVMLTSLAACSAIDVVDILGKRRTPPDALRVEVSGTRRDELPRRFVKIDLRYVVDGTAVEPEHAERAIALAFEKYCSAASSLAPDIEFSTTLVLNGEAHPTRPQKPGG